MRQKKPKLYLCLILLSAFLISNCGIAVSSSPSPIATIQLTESSTPTETKTPRMAPPPTLTFTPSPVPIVLPVVTMLPQAAENALQELLRTNGNCTGKCLAGIYPDEMTVQEAVDQMARWGMLRMSNKDKNGRIFIGNVYLNPNSKQVNINLFLSLRNETVDSVSFQIPRNEDGELGADVWLANRETWKAFQFGNLLKAYGTPSFVGFLLQSGDPENGSVAYTLDIQYEQLNLDIGIGGYARTNGSNVFICPPKDPHDLGININPEVSLKELQQASPITWQALTGSDLQTFYQTFTDKSNPDACLTTTMKKIIELDPTFR